MLERIINLWRTVARRELAAFVVLPVGLTVIAAFIPGYAVVKIIVFGVIVLLWALEFPRRVGLPRDAADFWYYTLGGVGVILFFVNSADQRERVALAQEFNLRTVELASFLDRRTAVEAILRDPQRVLDRIRQNAGTSADSLGGAMLDSACRQRATQKQLKVPGTGTGADTPTPLDAMCEDLTWRPTLAALAKAKTADELAAHLHRTDLARLNQMLGVDLGPLHLDEAVRYLVDIQAGRPVARELADQESALRSRLAELKNRYEGVGRSLQPGADADTGAVQYFLWPYVLLTALGLKLGRVTYFGPAPVE